MSKKILNYCFFALTILLLHSCGNKDAKGYSIQGKLKNITDSIFFAAREYPDSLVVDTFRIDKDGEFSFKGQADTLSLITLYFNNNTSSTFVFVDKDAKISIEGDASYPDLIKVKGGNINDDLTAFKSKNEALLKSKAEIVHSYKTKTNTEAKKQEKEYVVNLKNINFELANIAAAYVKDNPQRIASVMLINSFFRDENAITRLDESLDLLQGQAALYPLTKSLKDYSAKVKISAPGAKAPFLKLKDSKGKDVSLNDYKGKYVLLNFISATCQDCIDAKRETIAAYNELKKENIKIDFVSVLFNSEIKPIDNATDSIKWTILEDQGGWAAKSVELYNVDAVPYNILISPDGVIQERDVLVFSLKDKLKQSAKKEGNKK